jgi:hypothetical protein
MSEKRLIHPEHVIKLTGVILLAGTYGFALCGFFFAQPRLYDWAKRLLLATVIVSLIPLAASVVGIAIERTRGKP